jgi:hypothetical protein
MVRSKKRRGKKTDWKKYGWLAGLIGVGIGIIVWRAAGGDKLLNG